MYNTEKIKKNVVNELKLAGFVAVGFSVAKAVEDSWANAYKMWIHMKKNANMSWAERNMEKRLDPTLLLEGTKTIISMLHLWPKTSFDKGKVRIAAYAQGYDYHNYLRSQANKALDILAEFDSNFNHRFFTDSAPILDRYWAWNAGLGFVGKNGFLINPDFGSRVFISHILTSINFKTIENKIENGCGTCNKCIDSCPTSAFSENGNVDAKKCIAYYNIEAKEETPCFVAEKNQGWIFGCDSCQEFCPYNQKKIVSEYSKKMRGKFLESYDEFFWENLEEETFLDLFSHSPILRAGLDKIKKNLKLLKI